MKALSTCKGCGRKRLLNILMLCKRCNKDAGKYVSKKEMEKIQADSAAASAAASEAKAADAEAAAAKAEDAAAEAAEGEEGAEGEAPAEDAAEKSE